MFYDGLIVYWVVEGNLNNFAVKIGDQNDGCAEVCETLFEIL